MISPEMLIRHVSFCFSSLYSCILAPFLFAWCVVFMLRRTSFRNRPTNAWAGGRAGGRNKW